MFVIKLSIQTRDEAGEVEDIASTTWSLERVESLPEIDRGPYALEVYDATREIIRKVLSLAKSIW